MPTPALISLENVSLRFGGKPLFEDITLHIGHGERICLIGRNGAGKTTLMRLITGELELDGGTRFMQPGIRIGYLAQTVAFAPAETVRDFVLGGLSQEEQDWESRSYLADMAMSPLELNPDSSMETLSGGQRRRAAMARALVEQPDILLLDEPTNHLDLAAIEWLEGTLAAYPGTLICVSHDRAFLRAVSRRVVWIDRGRLRLCPKGYSDFDAWQEQMLEQEARELHNAQKKLAAEEQWTQGGVTGRRKRNQRRMRELHQLRAKLKADKAAYNQTIRTIELDPLSPVQQSKIVCEFKQVDKSFTRENAALPILRNFNLRVMRGDRIGILGPNGSGKSTFLKLLVGELEPDKGRVFLGKTVGISYFDQHREALNPQKTLWQTLCPDGGDHVFLCSGEEKRPRHVCAYLKDFLFDPKQARDLVGTLSGGQRHRLMLAKLLINPGNLLILDEPTNDLDMDTLDMLQEILADYPGTLMLVSHDRDFLDRTVTKVLAFEGEGRVEGYIGGYSDYLEATGKSRPGSRKSAPTAAADNSNPQAPRSTAPKKQKLSYKYRHELEKLPGIITALEQEISDLQAELGDPELYMRDPARFDTASARLEEARTELEEKETRWLVLEAMREAAGE